MNTMTQPIVLPCGSRPTWSSARVWQPDRFTFTTAQVQERRRPVGYLVAGLGCRPSRSERRSGSSRDVARSSCRARSRARRERGRRARRDSDRRRPSPDGEDGRRRAPQSVGRSRAGCPGNVHDHARYLDREHQPPLDRPNVSDPGRWSHRVGDHRLSHGRRRHALDVRAPLGCHRSQAGLGSGPRDLHARLGPLRRGRDPPDAHRCPRLPGARRRADPGPQLRDHHRSLLPGRSGTSARPQLGGDRDRHEPRAHARRADHGTSHLALDLLRERPLGRAGPARRPASAATRLRHPLAGAPRWTRRGPARRGTRHPHAQPVPRPGMGLGLRPAAGMRRRRRRRPRRRRCRRAPDPSSDRRLRPVPEPGAHVVARQHDAGDAGAVRHHVHPAVLLRATPRLLCRGIGIPAHASAPHDHGDRAPERLAGRSLRFALARVERAGARLPGSRLAVPTGYRQHRRRRSSGASC